jgi:hypothetical protein
MGEDAHSSFGGPFSTNNIEVAFGEFGSQRTAGSVKYLCGTFAGARPACDRSAGQATPAAGLVNREWTNQSCG